MILRVFPSRTKATPWHDPLSFSCAHDRKQGAPQIPDFIPWDEVSEVHVSVTFSWDLDFAAELADMYSRRAPTRMGGPATGQRGEEFTPGRYLKEGYVITSRGCNNSCWFCSVPLREGSLRELPIRDGYNVLDDNLLACSEEHIRGVFDMLGRQKEQPILSGGIEARLLKPWHVELFDQVKVKSAFFAYDTPDDLDPLVEASNILHDSNWYEYWKTRCYILVGYPGDTLGAAEQRCLTTLKLGYDPFAMFYRDPGGTQEKDKAWTDFQITWARSAAINTTAKKLGIKREARKKKVMS